jgi:hypothetical protein
LAGQGGEAGWLPEPLPPSPHPCTDLGGLLQLLHACDPGVAWGLKEGFPARVPSVWL